MESTEPESCVAARSTPSDLAEPPDKFDNNLSLFDDSRPETTSAPAAMAASHTTPPDAPARNRRRSIPWAQLLMRVFHLDALACPRCATPMVVLALLSEPDVVRKILLHLGLPAEVPPTSPARQPDETLFDEDFQTGAPARSPP